MKKSLLILLGICGLLNSCRESAHNRDLNKESDLGETEISPEAVLTIAVEKWNEGINLRDQKTLEDLFATQVYFYTLELSGAEAARQKVERAIADPTWGQKIISDIDIEDLGNDLFKTSFTKQSESSKGTHTYRAYLIWENINGKWVIVRESDLLTDRNQEKHSKIPDDAISGDFDGDGITDHLWVEAKYDKDGYIIGVAKLRSDNKKLEGLTWKATRGVLLENLGKISNSKIDLLGVVPEYDSSWSHFYTYGFSNGKLKQLLDSFSIWEGDEDYKRVRKAKSGRPGYVGIYFNDMSDPEKGFEQSYKEVKIDF